MKRRLVIFCLLSLLASPSAFAARLCEAVLEGGFFGLTSFTDPSGRTYLAKDGYFFEVHKHLWGERGDKYTVVTVLLNDAGIERQVVRWELLED